MTEPDHHHTEPPESDASPIPPEAIEEEIEFGRIGYGSLAKYSPLFLGLLIVGVVVFAGWRAWQPEDELPRTGQLLDEPAPAFELQLLDGATVTNESLLGQAVALNFWGSWCAPCEAEMPALDDVYTEMTAQGEAATIIGVGIKNDYEPNARELIERLEITYPIGRDTAGEHPQRGPMEFAFGVSIYPSTVFIRPDGTIFAVRIGEMERDEIAAYLEGAAE